MSRYDSRSGDPTSYRDRRSDSGFGGASAYASSVRSSSSRRDYDGAELPRKLDLDGLTPFEKNFYVESLSVAAMSEMEVEGYRQWREITVEGRDVPKPMKSFGDVVFQDYVHRIDRTGRAGAKGTAYTFFTAANARFAKELIAILKEAGQKVSPELAAMRRGAPPPPSGHGGFRDRGRGYGGGRPRS